eukprot:5384595-Amphidinium_carterae.1
MALQGLCHMEPHDRGSGNIVPLALGWIALGAWIPQLLTSESDDFRLALSASVAGLSTPCVCRSEAQSALKSVVLSQDSG